MKKMIYVGLTPKLAAALVAMGLIAAAANVNAQAPTKEKTDEILELAASKDANDRVQLDAELTKLAASGNEQDVFLARRGYYVSGRPKISDSLETVELQRFPLGFAARDNEAKALYAEKGGDAMAAAYEKWVAKFPPEKFKTGEEGDQIEYDYVVSAIANRYAEEKNTAKAKQYIRLLREPFWKPIGYSGLSAAFRKNADLPDAEAYEKLAMEGAKYYADGKGGDGNAAKFAASGYAGLTSTYADILMEENKVQEAMPYLEASYKATKELNPIINYRYASALMKVNKNDEAFKLLEEVVKAGKATPDMTATFKQLYVATKGSDAGYDQYAAAIRDSYLHNLSTQLKKEMLKETAADFTLTDLDGKVVSLKDFKGKIIILDFWATWCGPCKASFPAMQMAQNKYANDPNVKFLFIHTWEKSKTPAQDAKDFIQQHNYNFEVLMDTKDPDTKVNKAVTAYGVNGIPAKFIIDGDGNIRFKLTGFDGSAEAAVDELSMMIEMTRKGNS